MKKKLLNELLMTLFIEAKDEEGNIVYTSLPIYKNMTVESLYSNVISNLLLFSIDDKINDVFISHVRKAN